MQTCFSWHYFFGIGWGNKEIPDVFASDHDALCFIDYDIKCKHDKDFITHIDYERDCSTWYEDLVKELEAQPQVRIIKRYLKRTQALANTCIDEKFNIATFDGKKDGVSVSCVNPKVKRS